MGMSLEGHCLVDVILAEVSLPLRALATPGSERHSRQ